MKNSISRYLYILITLLTISCTTDIYDEHINIKEHHIENRNEVEWCEGEYTVECLGNGEYLITVDIGNLAFGYQWEFSNGDSEYVLGSNTYVFTWPENYEGDVICFNVTGYSLFGGRVNCRITNGKIYKNCDCDCDLIDHSIQFMYYDELNDCCIYRVAVTNNSECNLEIRNSEGKTEHSIPAESQSWILEDACNGEPSFFYFFLLNENGEPLECQDPVRLEPDCK